MLFRSLTIICFVSIWGSIIYRFYALNNFGVFFTIVLSSISYFIISRRQKIENSNKKAEKSKEKIEASDKYRLYFLFSFFYFLLFSCFLILFNYRTSQAIVSPWQVVPWYFFLYYFASTFVLLIIANNRIIKKINDRFIFLSFIFYSFLSFGVALIIYKINYGFDPFIHQATLDLINQKGFVNPKPFYYLGQYSLEIVIHKITNISLVWIDKLLVPIMAAVYLPITIYQAFKEQFKNKSICLVATLSLLIFPFSFFIITTPQNLAYLFLLLVILLSFKSSSDITMFLLSLAAIVIQPIAGIPALLFFSAIWLNRLKQKHILKFKKYLYLLILTLITITLPLLFYIFEKDNNYTQLVELDNLNFFNIPQIIILNKGKVILNSVYFFGFNISIFIAILVLIGVLIVFKKKEKYKNYFIYLDTSLALFLSYLLTINLRFNFLIDYERSNYANRIFVVASFFLLPFVMLALQKIVSIAMQQKRVIRIILGIFLVLLITTSLYMSYPRRDAFFNSRGYSTGKIDIKAVKWIKNNSKEDYIVLANQQVSAAALRLFGFYKYYNNDIFYYPIPTGGPLYQHFLDMVYKDASRKTMQRAMDLAGVDTGYFVLNKYWWAYRKILDQAKFSADSWQQFGDGEVYVFKYKK